MTTYLGTPGNDVAGGDGYDTLYGADGDDFLIPAEPGYNTADGGKGSDFLVFNCVDDSTYGALFGGDGNDTVIGYKHDDFLYGEQGNDLIMGGYLVGVPAAGGQPEGEPVSGNDYIDGGFGTDAMYGFDGDDRIYGGDGDDSGLAVTPGSGVSVGIFDPLVTKAGLFGGDGADYLDGGAGKDTVDGGTGKDWLIGGSGADAFVFESFKDSKVGSKGRDTIADFSQASHDRIDLSGIDAITKSVGDQGFHFIGAKAFTHHAGELQAKFVGADTLVSGDVNGNGTADFAILVKGHVAFHAGDFIL